MWIVVHLQKCQAIKLAHVNELILIGMDRKKCRLLFISNLQTDDNVETPLN